MAEAVRRYRETGGSDVVRRLLARPIRLDPPRSAPHAPSPQVPSSSAADEVVAVRGSALDSGAWDCEAEEPDAETFEDDGTEDGSAAVTRLRAEMAVMKAVLRAERAESAALRAQIAGGVEVGALGAEARATRERWAGIVDCLLLSAR